MSSRLILLCGLCVSASAFAQLDEPNGIKIGDGRLHPYLDLEARFDSAVGYFGKPPTLTPDVPFRFRPGLRFELPGTNNIIHFNGNAEYVFYPGFFASGTREASRFQTVPKPSASRITLRNASLMNWQSEKASQCGSR